MTLKIVIRNLVKRPFLNLVKIIGLSLSLGGLMLIILYLSYQLSFESFNNKASRIFRLTLSESSSGEREFARIPDASFVPEMAGYFPEIEQFVRLSPVRGGLIKYSNDYFTIKEGFQCDSTFFDVFKTGLISGNHERLLDAPKSMIISESFARKVFGRADPVGRILTLPAGQYYSKKTDFTVKGVMKDFPANSHFHPEFVATPADKSEFREWAWVYLLLHKNSDVTDILSRSGQFFKEINRNDQAGKTPEAHLQNIKDIHLRSDKLREIEDNSSMSVIWTLATASLILLLISLTNYANLNIAMAGFSEKYLFISKVCGSDETMSLRYFITESSIIILLSLLITAFLCLPAGIFIQKNFGLDLFSGNIMSIISVVLIFGLLVLLSGILPVMKWRRRSLTVTDLRNRESLNRKSLSRIMIVLQYAVSTALIAAVLVIIRQTRFAMENTMDARNKNLICFRDVHSDIQSKFPVFKEELLKLGSVESVTAMLEPPGGEANDMFEFKMEGYVPDESVKTSRYIGVFPCDYSFAEAFRLQFLGGSNFSQKDQDNEGSGEYIINESAMNKLGYNDASRIVDKEFRLITNIPGIELPDGKITGVVKDFHLRDIKKKAEPLVLFKRKDLWLINFIVSLQPGKNEKALKDVESVWRSMFPGYPCEYEYVSSVYKNVYSTELLESALLMIFTLISLFICSMGLLGMALLSGMKRIKETGLRKISGADRGELIKMLLTDMLKWVLLSFLIAIPAAYFAMYKWLGNFAYKIDLSWWIFILSCFIALAIAFLTISIQTWRAASANPVEALKYE